MGNDKSTNKLKYIANLLANTKDAKDVLNDKGIELKSDFQYICLNSGRYSDTVIDVISEVAKLDDISVIEENINLISMNVWKDLFNKNDSIKKIFINNFDKIFAYTNVMSCNEVDAFINDSKTSDLIYSNIKQIIIKLTTQDRASLIDILNEKPNGADIIKENIDYFFEKGAYGISTTYSKVLDKLTKTSGIEKIDILRACSDKFSYMISKATAFDNETTKLIRWLADAISDLDIDEDEKNKFESDFEKAILENFDSILEKTNFDNDTVELLKTYDCTKDSFEKVEQVEEVIEEPEEKSIEDYAQEITDEIDDEKNEVIEEEKIEEIKEENIVEDEKQEEVIEQQENKIEEESVESEVSAEQPAQEDFSKTKKYELSNELINAYISRYNKKNNSESGEEKPQENSQEELQEKLRKLIYNNIHQTDKIVDKVLAKNDNEIKEVEEAKQEIKQQPEENVEKVEGNITKENVEVKKEELVQEDPIMMKDSSKIENGDPIKNITKEISHDPVKKNQSLVTTNKNSRKSSHKGLFMRVVKRVLKIFENRKRKRNFDDAWS